MQTVRTKELSETSDINAAIPSTPVEIDYEEIVTRQANRKIKHGSTTTQNCKLNQAALFSSCCAEIRSHRGGISRLSNEEANSVSEAIAAFLVRQIGLITPNNVISVTRAFKFKSRENDVVEAITLKGENVIAAKEKLFALTLLVGKAQKRLTDLQAKPTPDYDAEMRCKQQLMQYQLTIDHINAEVERQKQLIG